MTWNKSQAVSSARMRAYAESQKRCAHYVPLCCSLAFCFMTFSISTFSAEAPDPYGREPVNPYGAPGKAALEFNRWYLQQYAENKNPLTHHEIERYVTADTLKKMRKLDARTEEYMRRTGDLPEFAYETDYFTKTQDISPDWPTHVSIVGADYDPACANVYVAFGKDKRFVLADCMVEEQHVWKVQSVTQIEGGAWRY